MLAISITDTLCDVVSMKGKGKRTQYPFAKQVTFENGCIINGFVQNDSSILTTLQTALSDIPSSYKREVMVQVNSSTTLYRKMSFPNLKKSELERNIYRAMESQMSALDEYALDYAILSDGKGKETEVLVCAMPKRLVMDYTELFRKLGISNIKMSAHVVGLLQWMRVYEPEYQTKNVIVAYQKDGLVSTTYLQQGNFEITNQYRLGKDAQTTAVLRQRITQMMQYQKTQNASQTITKVYLCCDDADKVAKALSEELTIEVLPLAGTSCGWKQEASITPYASAIGTMMPLAKTVDFTQYERFQVLLAKRQGFSKYMPVLLLANLVVVLGVFGFFYYQNIQLQQKNNELQMKMTNSKFMDDYEETINALQDASMLRDQMDQLSGIEERMDGYQAVDKDLIQKLESLSSKVTISQIDTKDYQWVTLVCEASTREATYQFVSKLEKDEMFSQVSYDGFTYQDGYQFTVSFFVKQGVTK